MGQASGRAHQENLGLIELFQRFPDDATAERWFEEQRWGHAGAPSSCPMCGSVDKLQAVPSGKPLPYWCGACRRNFSVRTNSVMHRSHISLQKWAIAIYLWSTSPKGVSSIQLHRDLRITQKSAWHLAHRLRSIFAGAPGGFSAPVEADETFVGGRRANMSLARRRQLSGRGPASMAVVAGIKDRRTNKVSAKVVADTSARTLRGFVRANTKPGATLYTDEAPGYKGMAEFKHRAVKHGAGEYVRGPVHTNGIESFWSILKRAHKGTYHQISPKHLDRYVQEFTGRHNMRGLDTIVQMASLARGMAGKRLTYRDLVA